MRCGFHGPQSASLHVLCGAGRGTPEPEIRQNRELTCVGNSCSYSRPTVLVVSQLSASPGSSPGPALARPLYSVCCMNRKTQTPWWCDRLVKPEHNRFVYVDVGGEPRAHLKFARPPLVCNNGTPVLHLTLPQQTGAPPSSCGEQLAALHTHHGRCTSLRQHR